MAIKFTSAKCPECGAMLPIEEGRSRLFCSYCGSQVIINNDNEQIYRHIDEAEVKKAEAEETVKLKKLELLEKKQKAEENSKKIKTMLSIPLGIIGVLFTMIGIATDMEALGYPGMICLMILMYMWLFSMNNDEKNDDINDLDVDGTVKVPTGAFNFKEKNYAAIETMFESAGFTNIKCVPLKDLTLGIFDKPGTVDSITINGKNIGSRNKKYSPNVKVCISYHSR